MDLPVAEVERPTTADGPPGPLAEPLHQGQMLGVDWSVLGHGHAALHIADDVLPAVVEHEVGAQLEGGAYEWRQHVPIALGVGVTQRQIDALERGSFDNDAFNAAERALLGFSREVTQNVRVPEPVFANMRKHFGEQEIVETIFAVGFYMMMARLTEATETDLDPAAGMKLFDSGKKRSA